LMLKATVTSGELCETAVIAVVENTLTLKSPMPIGIRDQRTGYHLTFVVNASTWLLHA